MKNVHWFLYGFLTCFFLLSVRESYSRSPQLSTMHDSTEQINAEFEAVYSNMQTREFELYPTTPTTATLPALNVVFFSSNGAVNSFTTYNGNRYYQPWIKM